MEVNRKRIKGRSSFGPTCTKYTLFLLNIVFVIASVLVIAISTSISLVAAFGLDMMAMKWIPAGIILLFVASFGIFAAFKESSATANSYGVAMIGVSFLQISVSIYSFALLHDTQNMVTWQLERMMDSYSDVYRVEVDWLQSNFQCCGISNPSDWQKFDRFSTTEVQFNETDLMPISCCEPNSNYVKLQCEQYYDDGCFEPIHQIILASIIVVGTVGFILSAVQIFGIILGFSYARSLRTIKTHRDIRVWNSESNNGQADPTSVRQQIDYSPVQ